MKIAILSPVWFPVPPTGYGGIEWIVSLLADGLVAAGHDVTLFASGDSYTLAQLVVRLRDGAEREDRPRADGASPCADVLRAGRRVRRDLRPLGPTRGGDRRSGGDADVHTVHGPLLGEPGDLYEQVARVSPRTGLISISINQRGAASRPAVGANIPNALDLAAYPFQPRAATTCSSSAA